MLSTLRQKSSHQKQPQVSPGLMWQRFYSDIFTEALFTTGPAEDIGSVTFCPVLP